MLETVMPRIPRSPYHPLGSKCAYQLLDERMHVCIGKILAGATGDIRQLQIDVIVLGEINDRLKVRCVRAHLRLTHVVKDQFQRRVSIRNYRYLIGELRPQVELDNRVQRSDLLPHRFVLTGQQYLFVRVIHRV